MHTLTVYYSVQNGGDGSAYPQWMESKELIEWDQDHLDEGWAEPCTGSITFESESPISVKENIQTAVGYLLEHTDAYGEWEDAGEFLEEFFPDGFPKLTIKPLENERRYGFYVGDKLVWKKFAYPEEVPTEEIAKKLEEKYNI